MTPFVALAFAARAIVPFVGDAVAHRLTVVARLARELSRGAPVGSGKLDDVRPRSSAPSFVASPVSSASRRSRPSAAAGIVVPAERVSQLTAAQLGRVRGVDAVDARGQPLGVRLFGVQALGLGLREGDVVTSLEGRPTPTLDEGTAAATSALGSGQGAAHATILRDGQTVAVTVTIPPWIAAGSGVRSPNGVRRGGT